MNLTGRPRKEKEQEGDAHGRRGEPDGWWPVEKQATFPSEVSINLVVSLPPPPPPSFFFFFPFVKFGPIKRGVSKSWKVYVGNCVCLCSCTYEGLIFEIGMVWGALKSSPG